MAANATRSSGAGPAIDLQTDTEPSLGELISRTTSHLSDLFRTEVELAKVEITDEVKTAGQAGAMLGAAGLTAYLAAALLCCAAAWGLAEVMPTGVAFAIVGLVVALGAAILYWAGRHRLENFEPAPRQTIETIKEDVEWAKQLRS